MGSPREEEDIVVPLRLERVGPRGRGSGGRSTALVAGALVAFLAFGLGLGVLSTDRRPSRLPPLILAETTPSPPTEATASPTARPTASRIPLATALPELEVSGTEAPTERRLVYADGMEVLDLANGVVSKPSSPLYDSLLPIGDDQLVCACISGLPAEPNPTATTRTIKFERFDLTGQPLVEHDVLTFEGIVGVRDQTDGFNATTALSDDGQTLYVLTVARQPPVWTIDLTLIDVETGSLLGGRTIGRFPVDLDGAAPNASPAPGGEGAPPNGAYAWATFVTPAPGDETVMVTVQASEWRDGVGTNRYREWMVPIRNRRPGTPVRIGSEALLAPNDWCLHAPWFIDPSLLVAVCAKGESPDASPFYIRRVKASGADLGDVSIDGLASTDGYLSVVVEKRSGDVIAWDPVGHSLARIDVRSGQSTLSRVSEGLRPNGSAFDRSRIYASPALVLSPDGLRAYAIGIGPGSTSSGIWVFDARTLELLDHWAPRAALNSIAVSADGRFVYATGAAGVDVDGNQNNLWKASVTVYDAAGGEVQRLYGDVAGDMWMAFASWD